MKTQDRADITNLLDHINECGRWVSHALNNARGGSLKGTDLALAELRMAVLDAQVLVAAMMDREKAER